ncbi:conserved phage C-terminal domain-containing protein [Staphylococcus arlettae]|uniref:conserved phage C-terminal domain-containing protein n=1 Tax=Staphylococcus arlettae TaxID=29378 RepID=UPI003EE058CF
MATFRTVKQDGDFVLVHKKFIYDPKLSARSKGVLLYLLSRPNDWQIYTSEIQKHMTDGIKSVNSAVKELMGAGYIKRTLKRSEKGTFKGYEYLVYEIPTEMPFAENGQTENGLAENGQTENRQRHTTNNNSTNNDLTNNNNTNNDSNTSATNVTRERFEEWWKLYDKKLDKKKAFSLFKSALKEHGYETIMSGTREYLKTITNKQYQKYPKTFLSQESYMNDFTEEMQPTGQDQLERMKYDPSYWD